MNRLYKNSIRQSRTLRSKASQKKKTDESNIPETRSSSAYKLRDFHIALKRLPIDTVNLENDDGESTNTKPARSVECNKTHNPEIGTRTILANINKSTKSRKIPAITTNIKSGSRFSRKLRLKNDLKKNSKSSLSKIKAHSAAIEVCHKSEDHKDEQAKNNTFSFISTNDEKSSNLVSKNNEKRESCSTLKISGKILALKNDLKKNANSSLSTTKAHAAIEVCHKSEDHKVEQAKYNTVSVVSSNDEKSPNLDSKNNEKRESSSTLKISGKMLALKNDLKKNANKSLSTTKAHSTAIKVGHKSEDLKDDQGKNNTIFVNSSKVEKSPNLISSNNEKRESCSMMKISDEVSTGNNSCGKVDNLATEVSIIKKGNNPLEANTLANKLPTSKNRKQKPRSKMALSSTTVEANIDNIQKVKVNKNTSQKRIGNSPVLSKRLFNSKKNILIQKKRSNTVSKLKSSALQFKVLDNPKQAEVTSLNTLKEFTTSVSKVAKKHKTNLTISRKKNRVKKLASCVPPEMLEEERSLGKLKTSSENNSFENTVTSTAQDEKSIVTPTKTDEDSLNSNLNKRTKEDNSESMAETNQNINPTVVQNRKRTKQKKGEKTSPQVVTQKTGKLSGENKTVARSKLLRISNNRVQMNNRKSSLRNSYAIPARTGNSSTVLVKKANVRKALSKKRGKKSTDPSGVHTFQLPISQMVNTEFRSLRAKKEDLTSDKTNINTKINEKVTNKGNLTKITNGHSLIQSGKKIIKNRNIARRSTRSFDMLNSSQELPIPSLNTTSSQLSSTLNTSPAKSNSNKIDDRTVTIKKIKRPYKKNVKSNLPTKSKRIRSSNSELLNKQHLSECNSPFQTIDSNKSQTKSQNNTDELLLHSSKIPGLLQKNKIDKGESSEKIVVVSSNSIGKISSQSVNLSLGEQEPPGINSDTDICKVSVSGNNVSIIKSEDEGDSLTENKLILSKEIKCSIRTRKNRTRKVPPKKKIVAKPYTSKNTDLPLPNKNEEISNESIDSLEKNSSDFTNSHSAPDVDKSSTSVNNLQQYPKTTTVEISSNDYNSIHNKIYVQDVPVLDDSPNNGGSDLTSKEGSTSLINRTDVSNDFQQIACNNSFPNNSNHGEQKLNFDNVYPESSEATNDKSPNSQNTSSKTFLKDKEEQSSLTLSKFVNKTSAKFESKEIKSNEITVEVQHSKTNVLNISPESDILLENDTSEKSFLKEKTKISCSNLDSKNSDTISSSKTIDIISVEQANINQEKIEGQCVSDKSVLSNEETESFSHKNLTQNNTPINDCLSIEPHLQKKQELSLVMSEIINVSSEKLEPEEPKGRKIISKSNDAQFLNPCNEPDFSFTSVHGNLDKDKLQIEHCNDNVNKLPKGKVVTDQNSNCSTHSELESKMIALNKTKTHLKDSCNKKDSASEESKFSINDARQINLNEEKSLINKSLSKGKGDVLSSPRFDVSVIVSDAAKSDRLNSMSPDKANIAHYLLKHLTMKLSESEEYQINTKYTLETSYKLAKPLFNIVKRNINDCFPEKTKSQEKMVRDMTNESKNLSEAAVSESETKTSDDLAFKVPNKAAPRAKKQPSKIVNSNTFLKPKPNESNTASVSFLNLKRQNVTECTECNFSEIIPLNMTTGIKVCYSHKKIRKVSLQIKHAQSKTLNMRGFLMSTLKNNTPGLRGRKTTEVVTPKLSESHFLGDMRPKHNEVSSEMSQTSECTPKYYVLNSATNSIYEDHRYFRWPPNTVHVSSLGNEKEPTHSKVQSDHEIKQIKTPCGSKVLESNDSLAQKTINTPKSINVLNDLEPSESHNLIHMRSQNSAATNHSKEILLRKMNHSVLIQNEINLHTRTDHPHEKDSEGKYLIKGAKNPVNQSERIISKGSTTLSDSCSYETSFNKLKSSATDANVSNCITNDNKGLRYSEADDSSLNVHNQCESSFGCLSSTNFWTKGNNNIDNELQSESSCNMIRNSNDKSLESDRLIIAKAEFKATNYSNSSKYQYTDPLLAKNTNSPGGPQSLEANATHYIPNDALKLNGNKAETGFSGISHIKSDSLCYPITDLDLNSTSLAISNNKSKFDSSSVAFSKTDYSKLTEQTTSKDPSFRKRSYPSCDEQNPCEYKKVRKNDNLMLNNTKEELLQNHIEGVQRLKATSNKQYTTNLNTLCHKDQIDTLVDNNSSDAVDKSEPSTGNSSSPLNEKTSSELKERKTDITNAVKQHPLVVVHPLLQETSSSRSDLEAQICEFVSELRRLDNTTAEALSSYEKNNEEVNQELKAMIPKKVTLGRNTHPDHPPEWFRKFICNFRKQELWGIHQIFKIHDHLIRVESAKLSVLEKLYEELRGNESLDSERA